MQKYNLRKHFKNISKSINTKHKKVNKNLKSNGSRADSYQLSKKIQNIKEIQETFLLFLLFLLLLAILNTLTH